MGVIIILCCAFVNNYFQKLLNTYYSTHFIVSNLIFCISKSYNDYDITMINKTFNKHIDLFCSKKRLTTTNLTAIIMLKAEKYSNNEIV